MVSNLKTIIILKYSKNIIFEACMLSQCKNGGSCNSISSTNFTCQCINDYYGRLCEYKKLNSTIFENSTILTQEESVDLVNLINMNKNWTLIYQSSVDGLDPIKFHSKCDDVKNVLVITKSINSNVFGGYTSVGWTSQYGIWPYDSSAFLFSLKNKYNKSVKLNVTRPENAVFSYYNYGPVFGSGYDLILSNRQDSYSYCNLGNSYEKPSFINPGQEAQTFLAGSYGFFVSEIEVYSSN